MVSSSKKLNYPRKDSNGRSKFLAGRAESGFLDHSGRPAKQKWPSLVSPKPFTMAAASYIAFPVGCLYLTCNLWSICDMPIYI